MDEHIRRTIETYDRIAGDYRLTATAELRAWEENSMRLFQQLLPGSRVLVPGCGDGRDSRFLSSIGLEVQSFDLSEGMLAEARKQDPVGMYERDLRDIVGCLEITMEYLQADAFTTSHGRSSPGFFMRFRRSRTGTAFCI